MGQLTNNFVKEKYFNVGVGLIKTRLAKRREILIFPSTAGNTGNSRELLVIPGNN